MMSECIKGNLNIIKPLHVLPGFRYLEGTFETGYVVTDSEGNTVYGNEFVWYPIKICDLKEYDEKSKTFLPYNGMVDADLKKYINKYGGFYISRYMASAENQSNIVFKNKSAVYTTVIKPEIKEIAENAVKLDDDTKSRLIPKYIHHTILWFLSQKLYNIEDSRGWGNFADSLGRASLKSGCLERTGENDSWKAYNTCDLAGNCLEVIEEISYVDDEKSNLFPIGGSSNSSGIDAFSISYNNSGKEELAGFRVMLYK